MTEISQIQHPTVIAAQEKWIQFLHWLSSTRAVLLHSSGFIHFTKFESLAKALRRAGMHYFEYQGYIIWELGRSTREKSGIHIHKFLIDSRGGYPDFPLAPKQKLDVDELNQLRSVLSSSALVGKDTFPKDAPAALKKIAQPTLNRRRKANQQAQTDLDMTRVSPVTTEQRTVTTQMHHYDYVLYNTGAEQVTDYMHYQYSAPYTAEWQMYSASTALMPESPSSESCSSPLSAQYSASESDGLDESSFQSSFSFYFPDMFNLN